MLDNQLLVYYQYFGKMMENGCRSKPWYRLPSASHQNDHPFVILSSPFVIEPSLFGETVRGLLPSWASNKSPWWCRGATIVVFHEIRAHVQKSPACWHQHPCREVMVVYWADPKEHIEKIRFIRFIAPGLEKSFKLSATRRSDEWWSKLLTMVIHLLSFGIVSVCSHLEMGPKSSETTFGCSWSWLNDSYLSKSAYQETTRVHLSWSVISGWCFQPPGNLRDWRSLQIPIYWNGHAVNQ